MKSLHKHIKPHQHLILIFVAFILVYALSLTFVYVEGDDASTIAHHLLGRDETLRPRYALYQAMFDSVLSPLPASEPVLRVFAISLSALGAALFTMLGVKIAFHWSAIMPQRKLFYALLFLVMSPELFFAGLYINPSMIAFAFVLLAHTLLLSRDPMQVMPAWRLAASALLFGFGVAFRWNAALYGLVIFLDLTIPDHHRPQPERKSVTGHWRSAFTWLGFSALSSLLLVTVSVYNRITISGIFSIPPTLLALMAREQVSTVSLITIPRFISLFSPILIFLSGLGLISFCKKQSWKMVIIFTVQLLSLVFFLMAGKVKELMMLLPVMWVLSIEGIQALSGQQKSYRFLLAMIVLAFFPWVIGVQLYSSSTLWGPGFEIKQPGRASPIPNEQAITYAPGIRFGLSAAAPVLDAGFALASPEGPRPLGGYGYVLLGGRWRSFHQEIDQDLRNIAQAGVAAGRIIKLGAGSDARLVNTLLQNGFMDYAPIKLIDPELGCMPSRSVTDLDENTTLIYYAYDDSHLLADDKCACHPDLCDRPIPLYTNYTSDLNALVQRLPTGQLSILGPFTGIFEATSFLSD